MSVKYRGTDPSYIGNLDINVYSSSSPGLSGSLTPFAKTTGLFFNSSPEPQNMEYTISEEIAKVDEENGILTIGLGKPGDPLSYYDARMKILDHYNKNFSITRSDNGILQVCFADEMEDGEVVMG